MCVLVYFRQRSDTTVAVLTGAVDWCQQSARHLVDRQRLGIPSQRPRRDRASLGRAQEEAEDELRETEPRPALLLRQEHHTQDGRTTLCLPVCVQPRGRSGMHASSAVRRVRSSTAVWQRAHSRFRWHDDVCPCRCRTSHRLNVQWRHTRSCGADASPLPLSAVFSLLYAQLTAFHVGGKISEYPWFYVLGWKSPVTSL